MEYKITGYKPEALFHYFEEISAIPRGSGNEKAISEYVVNQAKAKGYEYYTDDMYNVVVKKPASAGAEDAPAVMLQGHLDMVCEKNAGVVHDFEKDGIDLIVEDGRLRANGTTLGADNGIAVAMMLAILADDSLEHPALECVFTSQEETGLFGAAALDGSVLDARIMINLDSEDEGIATVSCAGGMRFTMKKEIHREREQQAHVISLAVRGLFGGHSGTDIHLERGNANKILGRFLHHVLEAVPMKLVSITGGNKDNAIPREAEAVIAFEDAQTCRQAEDIIANWETAIRKELAAVEPDFRIEVRKEERAVQPYTGAASREIISLIYLAPNGAQNRNVAQDGFIVTSLNLGVIREEAGTLSLHFAPRSSVASYQEEIKSQLKLMASIFGFESIVTGQYPGWSYAEHSVIRDMFCESYRELYGKELKLEAIHAGLECGLFCGKLPDLDAIAVGPDCHDVHTPSEWMDLGSSERTYQLLADVLKRIAKK